MIQKEWFGNVQTMINVRTGSASLVSLVAHSCCQDKGTNPPKRKEFNDIVEDKSMAVDSFYHDGDITCFEAYKAAEMTTEWKT